MIALYTFEEFDKAKSRDLLKLQCMRCLVSFSLKKHVIQKALKPTTSRYYGKYCSRECSWEAQNKAIKCLCDQCGIEFLKLPNQIKKSKNHFCSRSCSAKYSNSHRTCGYRRSKIEKWIEEQFGQTHPDLEVHYNRKDTIGSELDIYIPSLKKAIEINGIFHYKPIYGEEKLLQIQRSDIKKGLVCGDRGITLLSIDVSSMDKFSEDESRPFLKLINQFINKAT